MRAPFAVAATAVVGLSLGQAALGQSDDQKLGKVHFETACKPAAQKHFDRARPYEHSFWYRASQMAFEDVLKADPECGFAYWGIALSLLWNPHVPHASEEPRRGRGCGCQGQGRWRKNSARARLYRCTWRHVRRFSTRSITAPALSPMRPPWSCRLNATQRTTRRRFTTRYRLTLRLLRPIRLTRNQLKGAAILEPIFKRQPQHPGIAHYLIHLDDYPPIAEKGLDAARPLRQDRSGGGACAAHAITHLHARRLLGRVDRLQQPVGATCCEGSRGFPRSAACHGLHGLCAICSSARTRTPRPSLTSMTTVTGFTETFLVGPYALSRVTRPGMRWNAVIGRRPQS